MFVSFSVQIFYFDYCLNISLDKIIKAEALKNGTKLKFYLRRLS